MTITEADIKRLALLQANSVMEWDDRTSPEDYEQYLFMTPVELIGVLEQFAESLLETGSTAHREAETGVAVKPLEWWENMPNPLGADVYSYIGECQSLVGLYRVSCAAPNDWVARFNGGLISRMHTSVAEAKAAAQADYEQRIRSALASPQREAEGREIPALDANEIWEFLFGDLKGAVPESLTNEVLARLASHINDHFRQPEVQ